ncbi:MAG: carbohydrate kinase family protein [Cellulosilyticaceae bacterium]
MKKMIDNKSPYVLVFGVSICDIFGFTDANYRSHDSNPGSVRVSFGGVCRNIAENMARVGLETKFISVLGDDEKGKNIMNHAASMNFDMSHSLIVEGGSTPTYMAILDHEGEMVSAIVDVKIADAFTREFIDSKAELINHASYMFFDADNPEMMEYIVKEYAGVTKFVLDPVSAAKAQTVKHLIKHFHTIKPNRYEAEVLCGFPVKTEDDVRKAGKYFKELGIENIFISLDADGIYYNNGQEEGIIKANNVPVVNVTGAGDAFVAGIGYGYTNEKSIIDTVKYAMAMSIITISHEETIHPNMGHELIEKYVQELEWVETAY